MTNFRHVNNSWDPAKAATLDAVGRLIYRSNILGADQRITNTGGGSGAEIHLTGGLLQPESGFLAGPQADAFIQQYHAKWAFLGAAGIDENAATNYNELVLTSEHLMIARSTHVVILADHTKIGRQAMCTLCPIDKIERLFTGAHPTTAEFVRQLGPRATALPIA